MSSRFYSATALMIAAQADHVTVEVKVNDGWVPLANEFVGPVSNPFSRIIELENKPYDFLAPVADPSDYRVGEVLIRTEGYTPETRPSYYDYREYVVAEVRRRFGGALGEEPLVLYRLEGDAILRDRRDLDTNFIRASEFTVEAA